jgi:hypothetical protein
MFHDELINEVSEIRDRSPVDLSVRDNLIKNLIFAYQVITASERLLHEAAQESTGTLRDYYISHLEEERGHAEWLENDLKTQGVNVREQPLIRVAVAMAGTQYYLIKHVDPAALLGYMAVLEGLPTSLEAVDLLEAMHGKELLKTLRFHAEHDLEHRKELFNVIDSVGHHEIIRISALQTAIYMDEFARSLKP